MIFKKYKLLKEENKALKEKITIYENTKVPVFKAETKRPIRFTACEKYDPLILNFEAEKYKTTTERIKEDYIYNAKEKLAKNLMQQAMTIEEDCFEPMIVAYIDVLL